jgi:Fur family ferric uptake transcriptional regulator
MCRQKGLRLTGQRRAVIDIIAGLRDHPDTEELHRRARAEDARISLATVYRTMTVLVGAGILTRHSFEDGRSRYELAGRPHHDHLIDRKSGKVIEFRSPEIEKLEAEIAARHGYRVVDHRLEIYVEPIGVAARQDRSSSGK